MNMRSTIWVAIVDDDESVCRSLGHLLVASDIESIAYLSADAFLADPRHRYFDCVLLDIQFPGMSGIELQRQLAAVAPHIPIIFITAHEAPEVRKQALAAGCAAFFQKTEAGNLVIQAIHNAIAPLSGAVSRPIPPPPTPAAVLQKAQIFSLGTPFNQ